MIQKPLRLKGDLMKQIPKIELDDQCEYAAFLFAYRFELGLKIEDIPAVLGVTQKKFDTWRFMDDAFTGFLANCARQMVLEMQPLVMMSLKKRFAAGEAGFKDYEMLFRLVDKYPGVKFEEPEERETYRAFYRGREHYDPWEEDDGAGGSGDAASCHEGSDCGEPGRTEDNTL